MRIERDRDLITKALEAVKAEAGFELNLGKLEVRLKGEHTGRWADAVVWAEIGGTRREYYVEAKRRLTKETLGAAQMQMRAYPGKPILITDYVNPKLAETMKERNVFFLDTVGNAFLIDTPLHIWVKGNKQKEDLGKPRRQRAFDKTGLKVLFAFLCEPEIVNKPYLEIAKIAGVAVGTVGWVITDMKENGLLIGKGAKKRKIVDKAEILRKWVAAYPDRLREKIVVGRYKAAEKNWWQNVKIQGFDAYWGGEIAAEKLTQYLKPEVTTLYMRERPNRLQVKNKLRNDHKGNIEILEAFWDRRLDWHEQGFVHPILVYADLIATGDERNIETAGKIYEERLARFIGEN